MGHSIAVAAGKGGTGKTTFTANLGAALGELGHSVVLVDADLAMANLELHFKLEGIDITLNDVLSGKADIEEALYRRHGVTIMPAGIPLDKLRNSNPELLADVLGYLEKNFEIMIVDAPAGIGVEVITALAVSQSAILVVNPEVSSLVDALKTKKVAQAYDTHVLGAVVNRITGGSSIPMEDISYILDTKVIAALPDDPKVKAAVMQGEPVVLRFPESPFSIEIKRFAAKLVGKEIQEKKESFSRRFLSRLLGW